MEWVEVSGRTVEIAVEYGLKELGLTSVDDVAVEVIQEGEKGFLGIGGKDAVVRLRPRAAGKRRRRRKRSKGEAGEIERPARSEHRSGNTGRTRNQDRQGERRTERKPSANRNTERREREKMEEFKKPTQEQADAVKHFLEGLIGAFGLDGTVSVAIEEDGLIADIAGEQTQAMVGPRGSVIEAIHEVAKIVMLRETGAGARLRLDIAGHGERRRAALGIYADQLIDQVLREGGEIVLEPMSSADRKVVHDAVAAREGVRSYSEGEAPRRYVVVSAVGGAATIDDGVVPDDEVILEDEGSGSEEE